MRTMTQLFTFESFPILAEPSPDELTESDVRWSLEVSRRDSKLFAERDETDPQWLLKQGEFNLETGRYKESLLAFKKAVSRFRTGDEHSLARALLFQSMSNLALVDGPKAERCLNKLTKLAANSSDRYLSAVHSLAKGMNLQYSSVYIKKRQIEKGASLARPFFEDAIAGLLVVGEVDLAIRAQIELARARFELGLFFSGIDMLEVATTLARERDCWGQIGRIILLFASNASDMGYRKGVKEVIHRALKWCDYLGDAWGRVEALTVLGRFIYYKMPADQPDLAAEPDTYLQVALEQAEALGMSRLKATVDSTRYFLYRKAGDDRKLQILLGDKQEEEEFRKNQALDNRREIERIADDRRRKTALRLHDGVEESYEAFFVFDALRDSEGKCRDFCWVYMNRAANEICGQSGSQVYLFSEASLLPQLNGLDKAMLQAVDGRLPFEDTLGIEIGGGQHMAASASFA